MLIDAMSNKCIITLMLSIYMNIKRNYVLLLPLIYTIFIPSICIVPIPHLMLFISLYTSLLILLKQP